MVPVAEAATLALISSARELIGSIVGGIILLVLLGIAIYLVYMKWRYAEGPPPPPGKGR